MHSLLTARQSGHSLFEDCSCIPPRQYICKCVRACVCAHTHACARMRVRALNHETHQQERVRRLREFTMIWSAHVVQTHKCPHGTKMAQPSDADCPCRHTTHSFSRGSGGAACAMLVVTGRASSSDACIRECVCFWDRESMCERARRERERER